MRKDIQGLRAIAVIAVLLYHFWPNRLPGGYVGVDIFFVISGFLITLHLLKTPPTSFKKLADFWAKRVRRLLPAATLVLLVTVAAGFIWLPNTMIPRMTKEAMAAAVYAENWMLASTETNYLDSEDAPSPIQHYWSLSVEEQYYIGWPIIIGLAFLLGRRYLSGRKVTSIAITVIFLISLAWSIYLTRVDAASAYFVTTTRIWELALGGITALISLKWRPSANTSRLLAWAGIGFIAATMVLFTKQTPFPGFSALLPTVGTSLIILAAIDSISRSPRFFLSPKPSQFVGDISYSIYLWHWPILIIAPYAIGASLTLPIKLALIVATILLAAITKRYVEDPMRKSRAFTLSIPRTFAYGFTTIVIVIGVSAGLARWNNEVNAKAALVAQNATAENTECYGAEAMRDDNCPVEGEGLYMTPAFAKADTSVLYKDKCWAQRPFTEHVKCTYGKQGSSVKIALLGNSHAGMWHAALEKLSNDKGWQLDTHLVSECYPITAPIAFSTKELSDNCAEWNKKTIETISEADYDMVVMSSKTSFPIANASVEERDMITKNEYIKTISSFTNSGKRVLVIRDTPDGGRNVPDCIAANDNDSEKCNNSRNSVIMYDALYAASQETQSKLVKGLDLTHLICDKDTCYTVIGGLIAYFDSGHLSNSFVKTLYPEISKSVQELLASK